VDLRQHDDSRVARSSDENCGTRLRVLDFIPSVGSRRNCGDRNDRRSPTRAIDAWVRCFAPIALDILRDERQPLPGCRLDAVEAASHSVVHARSVASAQRRDAEQQAARSPPRHR